MKDNIFKKLKDPKTFTDLPIFKSERSRKITNAILTLIAFSFLGLFAINPTISTIVKLKKELSDDQLVDRGLQQKITNISILQKKYTNLQSDLPIILSALPQTPQTPYLLAIIQAVAINSNIQLDNLAGFQTELSKEGATNTNQDYHSYSFSLGGSGSLEDISRFISTLTHMQRLVNAEVLSISTTAQKNKFKVNIQGAAYFKP